MKQNETDHSARACRNDALRRNCGLHAEQGRRNHKKYDNRTDHNNRKTDNHNQKNDSRADDDRNDNRKKEPVTPTAKKAFEGNIGDILDKIVAKAKEIDASEYGIGSIACHHREITADIAVDILGIDDEEFAKLIDSAIEFSPTARGIHIPL